MNVPVIRAFFDEPTNTVSYLFGDSATRRAAVIDPVLDHDHAAGGSTSARSRPSSRRPPTRAG